MEDSEEENEEIFVDLTAPNIIVIDLATNPDNPLTSELTSDGQLIRSYYGIPDVPRYVAENNLRRLQMAQREESRKRSKYVRDNVFRDVARQVNVGANTPQGETVERITRRRRTRRQINTEENKENVTPAPPISGEGLGNNLAYCVKCKQKQQMVDAKEIKTTNNRKALSGKCKVCGTKMMKFTK